MGSTVDYLIDKIVTILSDEASLLIGLRDELDDIKQELESMRSFLEDADAKGSYSHSHSRVEETWISEVRDLAYDVEDVIDEFVYKINKKQGRHKVIQSVRNAVALPKDIWVRHQLATKLQRLKTMITQTGERSMRYKADVPEQYVNFGSQKIVQYHGEASIFVDDEELVGIEDEREILVGWLIDGDPHRRMISVVGMGGSGKTTLVAKAFHSEIITRQFKCHAWITVSQSYAIVDLFRSMIKQFYQATKEAVPLDLSSMTYKQLVEKLMDYLKQRSYMVVLDDVWDMNLWNEIKVSLPNNDQGSRVMLTTRREDIASICCGVGGRIHRIKPLAEHEAWELFCKKAFSRNANRCPLDLEAFAKDIVQSCGGLPLAIVAMGCLMSSRELESEWKIISNSLKWELSNNQMLQMVKSILLLSYQDMPYRLKRCFLYCSLFPEDYLIKRKRLIRLWIAEGLVEQVGGSSQEEIADSYLVELIRRCMLQATERNPSGRPKSCKMHDLLRELALLIAKDERFCAVYDGKEEKDECLSRRLSIYSVSERQSLPFEEGISRLRSLFVFYADNLAAPSMDTLLSGISLLRVLDLEDLRIQKLPDVVMNLFNLRYLNLKRTLLVELPKTIGRLHNLQTLNLDETQIKVLPSGITELCKLEFLITSRLNHSCFYEFDFISGAQAPSGICHLNNLQVLGCIEATGDIAIELKNMKKLVRLDISNVRESYVVDLCSSIENMRLLRRLFVMTSHGDEVLEMDFLDPPPLLRRLTLVGKLKKIPSWFGQLQCLRTLYLNGSGMAMYQDPLYLLQDLPHLRWLILSNTYEGNLLSFKEGFQRLEILELHCFPQLQFICIGDRSVMPNVKELHIGKCMQLRRLPSGIEYLTKLQELLLLNVSVALINSIREERRENHRKIRHIPKITHFNMSESGWSQESLS